MKTIIHINQQKIRQNVNKGTRQPVITTKTYKSNDYANEVEILDKDGNVAARIIYSPDKPLSCGARCWIETQNQVRIAR